MDHIETSNHRRLDGEQAMSDFMLSTCQLIATSQAAIVIALLPAADGYKVDMNFWEISPEEARLVLRTALDAIERTGNAQSN
jgi:hypothetical protein